MPADALHPPEALPADDWPLPPEGWPPGVWRVPYNPGSVPGSAKPSSWILGANCQRFAYGVLSLFGRLCPPLRSAELWDDVRSTFVVSGEPQPLDLALFNASGDPFGAHIGLWLTSGKVLHLCREVGFPTAWPLQDFASRARYTTLIGFKRVRTLRVEAVPPRLVEPAARLGTCPLSRGQLERTAPGILDLRFHVKRQHVIP